MWVQKNVGIKNNLNPKLFWVQKILKFWGKNIFGCKEFWFKKFFWVIDIFGSKCFDLTKFWSKLILAQKILGPKIFLGFLVCFAF